MLNCQTMELLDYFTFLLSFCMLFAACFKRAYVMITRDHRGDSNSQEPTTSLGFVVDSDTSSDAIVIRRPR